MFDFTEDSAYVTGLHTINTKLQLRVFEILKRAFDYKRKEENPKVLHGHVCRDQIDVS